MNNGETNSAETLLMSVTHANQGISVGFSDLRRASGVWTVVRKEEVFHHIYRPPKKLRQGNVSTRVCLFTGGGVPM